ncbi:hypothetical protein [Streptomyces californicus]|uniref:hypothetical protein n=1 Tax=Streptomyces californicus TaxID=67351 RepID=UPI0033D78638
MRGASPVCLWSPACTPPRPLCTSDIAPFVVVGGASGSLIGLQPRIGTQVAQIVCYTLVTLTVLELGSWAATSRRSPHTAAVDALSFLEAGSAVLLVARPPLMLEARTGDVVCTGEAPRICLGRSYTRFGPGLRSRITPYTEDLESIGIEPRPSSGRTPSMLPTASASASSRSTWAM